MDKKQILREGSIARAVTQLDAIVAAYPGMRDLARIRDRLAARLGRVRTAFSQQSSAVSRRKTASIEIRETKKTLRTVHLIRVAREAKPLFRDEPAVLHALRVPPVRGTPTEHVEAAVTMAKALRPHQKFCVEEGFSKGFVKEMVDAANALRRADAETDALRQLVSTSTRDLRNAIAEGRRDVTIAAAALNANVRKLPAAERESLQKMIDLWARVAKVGKKVGRPKTRKRTASEGPSRTPDSGV